MNIIMFIVPHNLSTNNLIGCVNLFRLVHVAGVRCRSLVAIRYTASKDGEYVILFEVICF